MLHENRVVKHPVCKSGRECCAELFPIGDLVSRLGFRGGNWLALSLLLLEKSPKNPCPSSTV